ncbi:MAG: hypothetical protein N2645_19585 [Clostridia bacterium]|nr:hypothetical protein [Clostridia bacterium]
MKKLMIILIALSLGVGLAACKSKNETKGVSGEAVKRTPYSQSLPSTTPDKKEPKEQEKSSVATEKPKPQMVVNKYHPIFFIYSKNNESKQTAHMLGGSKDGKWYKVTDFNKKGKYTKDQDFFRGEVKDNYVEVDLVNGGETFNLYGAVGRLTQVQGGKPKFMISPASGEEDLSFDLDLIKKEDLVIGVNGEWNAYPRVPKFLNGNERITVDLDGDGKDEILSIHKSKPAVEEKRDTGLGQVDITFTVEQNSKKILIQKVAVDGIYVSTFKVMTLDLSGDGKMEVVTMEAGHNTTVSVYALEDGKTQRVLDYYEGD